MLTLEKVPSYNEDENNYPALPAVEELRSTVAASDGVIIATPEYNHGLPGVLKNALDWGSGPAFQSCFVNKPVLILSSSPAFTGGVGRSISFAKRRHRCRRDWSPGVRS